MEPRKFYETHVLENYNSWIADHTNDVKAMNAVSDANNMAAHLFNYLLEHAPEMVHGAKTEGQYRAYIAKNVCSDFQIVWDIADGHKHVKLRRPDREVATEQRALRYSDDKTLTYAEATFTYAESANLLMAELASGELRVLRVTVKRVLDMWDKLLTEAGI